MARAKGSGNIFQVGTTYYLRYTLDGQRKKISLKTKNKREAEKLAAELMNETIHTKSMTDVVTHVAKVKGIANENTINTINTVIDREQGSDLAIPEAWDTYIASANRPNTGAPTMKEYTRYWKRFNIWADGKYEFMHEITPKDAEKYCSYLLRTYKMGTATYNKYITFYKHIFKYV